MGRDHQHPAKTLPQAHSTWHLMRAPLAHMLAAASRDFACRVQFPLYFAQAQYSQGRNEQHDDRPRVIEHLAFVVLPSSLVPVMTSPVRSTVPFRDLAVGAGSSTPSVVLQDGLALAGA